MVRISLRREIEAICWKAGISPKDVESIEITPSVGGGRGPSLIITTGLIPVEGGRWRREITEIPYEWKYDDEEDTDGTRQEPG